MSDVFQPGAVVSKRYRVLRKLGGGGMADVYLCEDLTLGRLVAIKVLLPRLLADATFVERFRREAKAVAGLNHANVVSVYDWGELDGAYFIVMEYVEGETLKERIRSTQRLGGNEAVRITLQLLAGLAGAHRRGIVHRDVKPQNLLLREGRLVLADFGVAARAGDASARAGAGRLIGTACYAAPEQAHGAAPQPQADVYSLGVVFHEMLCGQPPFSGRTATELLAQHLVAPVPRLPRSLGPWQALVDRLLAKQPQQRPADADVLLQEIQRLAPWPGARSD